MDWGPLQEMHWWTGDHYRRGTGGLETTIGVALVDWRGLAVAQLIVGWRCDTGAWGQIVWGVAGCARVRGFNCFTEQGLEGFPG